MYNLCKWNFKVVLNVLTCLYPLYGYVCVLVIMRDDKLTHCR